MYFCSVSKKKCRYKEMAVDALVGKGCSLSCFYFVSVVLVYEEREGDGGGTAETSLTNITDWPTAALRVQTNVLHKS